MSVYADLADQYRQRIESGELENGHRLPPETELAAEHDVSVSTVSRFVRVLKEEGLVYTTHMGTFVGPRPVDPRVEAGRNQQIRCANKPRCNNIMEFRRQTTHLASTLAQVGWIYRGSVMGRLYFCHQCAPAILQAEK